MAKTERIVPSIAFSISASAKTMAGFLPPNSSETGRMRPAPARMIAAPVRVSPVKVTASTSGWPVRYSPALPGPKPWITL
nr:hypothetical protein [Oleomonas cavernae]